MISELFSKKIQFSEHYINISLFNIFQTDNEHCMLLALPCGRDEVDVLQQSKNLQTGFIMYLQQKQAAGIVNIAAPGSQQVRPNDYCTLL